MTTMVRSFSLLALILLGSASPAGADTKCYLKFHLEGWSAFYKTAHGGGRITCGNGQSANVVIRTRGGGITFGKSKIVDGHGEFSEVDGINELFGDYAEAEAHAGAGKSKDAQVVTKGTVSLALSGEGRGVDLGFAFGKFTIVPARVRHHSERRHADPPPPGTAY